MVSWVRVETRFTSHPKVLDIGPLGEALWLRGLCYAGEQLTDGFVPASFLRRMGDMKAIAVAAKLVTAGLWDDVDGGYRIHDYLDWQQSRDEVGEIRSKRAEAGRRGGQQKASNLLAKSQQNGQQIPSKLSSKTLPEVEVEEIETLKPHGFNDAPLPPKKINPDPKPAKRPTYPQDFESFFDAYPGGRGGRPETYQIWKQLSAEDKGAVLAAMPAFLAGRDWIEGFHPPPKTWLRDRRWEKPPAPMAANGRASPNDRAPTHRETAQTHYDTIQRIARGEA